MELQTKKEKKEMDRLIKVIMDNYNCDKKGAMKRLEELKEKLQRKEKGISYSYLAYVLSCETGLENKLICDLLG
jgi:hypothetical protein